MKRNYAMRAAGCLLVATLLSTCAVSGTFAKYVTSDSAQDTARVAKFGVNAVVAGDLFGTSYTAAAGNSIQTWTSATAGTVTADAANAASAENSDAANAASAENVVAPGTKNATGMTIAVSGKPEVSTQLTLNKMKNASNKTYVNSDIELVSGNYAVMVPVTVTVTAQNVGNYYKKSGAAFVAATAVTDTLYELKDAADLDADYLPVQWNVARTIGTTTTNTPCTGVGAVWTALSFAAGTQSPNTELSTTLGSAAVTWEWPFETTGNDGKDTILGDMIAAQKADDETWYVVKESGTAGTYNEVKYAADVKVAADSADTAVIAYTGETAPTAVYTNTADYVTSANVCAVLTVNFAADITVAQVD